MNDKPDSDPAKIVPPTIFYPTIDMQTIFFMLDAACKARCCCCLKEPAIRHPARIQCCYSFNSYNTSIHDKTVVRRWDYVFNDNDANYGDLDTHTEHPDAIKEVETRANDKTNREDKLKSDSEGGVERDDGNKIKMKMGAKMKRRARRKRQ